MTRLESGLQSGVNSTNHKQAMVIQNEDMRGLESGCQT
jgi:hypothetical protein